VLSSGRQPPFRAAKRELIRRLCGAHSEEKGSEERESTACSSPVRGSERVTGEGCSQEGQQLVDTSAGAASSESGEEVGRVFDWKRRVAAPS